MNINFTPEATRQLDMVKRTASITNGFVSGRVMGKLVLVEQLFPVNFDETDIEKIYPEMLETGGDTLLGVFFNNRPPFYCDWFREDIVIQLNPETQLEPVCYRWENKEQTADIALET
ncbi:MAG: hypothetical protein GY765_42290 [bacterium]|nr:hypothetical protein [bacterium]